VFQLVLEICICLVEVICKHAYQARLQRSDLDLVTVPNPGRRESTEEEALIQQQGRRL